MESNNKKQVLLVLTILVSLFSYSAFAGRGINDDQLLSDVENPLSNILLEGVGVVGGLGDKCGGICSTSKTCTGGCVCRKPSKFSQTGVCD
ncbi:hypothetical protein TorRG33x02_053920 [Trema orientale]|uniref:Uncharacterized protein n=1 Tax=Trema orientale TaxID=63057 RepID=A0A2P5FLV1_TREOI|nr:hypothetical protein TorRG33x02_053920 [Trema orientale]